MSIARLIILSGKIASGKSALAEMLAVRHGATVIKTRDLLLRLEPQLANDRGKLQRAGENRDKRDNGSWIAEALSLYQGQQPNDGDSGIIVLDSVRISGQIDALRKAFGTLVHHIHLRADDEILRERWTSRDGPSADFSTYADLGV